MDDRLIEVPPIIHFVWAGGTYLLPDPSADVIAEWAHENDTFTIYLWVDSETSGKSYDELQAFYFSLLTEKGVQPPQLKVKDIRQEGMIDECSRYEIERLRPNYGASSDILRYKILYEYGGAYFDSDVMPAKPGEISTGAIKLQDFHYENGHFLLYIDHLTQLPNRKVLPSDLKIDDVTLQNQIGNDSFICSKNNPLMKKIYEEVLKNYHDMQVLYKNLKAAKPKDVQIMLAYGNNYRLDMTVGMSGPHLVRIILRSNQFRVLKNNAAETILEVDSHLVAIRPLRTKDYCLTDPLENTLNWLKASIHFKRNLGEALQEIEKTVRFELHNFNILRVEDHIQDLCFALKTSYSEEICKNLLRHISPIVEAHPAKEDMVVQCTFKYPKVTKFYEKQKLIKQTIVWDMFDSEKKEVLRHAVGEALIARVLDSITKGTFKQDYPNDAQIRAIMGGICGGINFIEVFHSDPHCQNFAHDNGQPTNADDFYALCATHLINYGKIYQTLLLEGGSSELSHLLDETEATMKKAESLLLLLKPKKNEENTEVKGAPSPRSGGM